MMQTEAPYNPIRIRSIPQEMAMIAQEKGEGVTREDLRAAGYTEEQIDRHSHDAAVLVARGMARHVN